MLSRDGFHPGSTFAAPVKSVDSGTATGKLDSLTSSTIITQRIGPLDDVFSIYPEAKSAFMDAIHDANLDKGISGKGAAVADFHFRKERLLILLHLLKTYKDLDARQTLSLRDGVLESKDNQKALELLKSFKFAKGEKTAARLVIEKRMPSKEERLWRDANAYASSLSDSLFLPYLKTFPDANFLHDAAVKCEEAAYTCLRTQLYSLVSGISQKILSIQEGERNKQVKRKVKNEEEKELGVSRVEFIQKTEDLCRERSKS